MKFNWVSQTANYEGHLQFPAVVDNPTGMSIPAVSIPLFIKDHPVPTRKPKLSEINTTEAYTRAAFDNTISAAFFGSPEPLNVSISGWLVTPTKNQTDYRTPAKQLSLWYPTVSGSPTAAALQLLNVSYADLICAYIDGRLSRTNKGKFIPRHPYAYIDPYGNQYNNPIITSFDFSQTVNVRKQQFSMTLYLEPWNA